MLEGDALRLRFISDRGQLLLHFEPLDGKESYSIDLLRRLLTGKRQDTAELSPDYAAFLERELGEIERRFRDERDETERALQELMRVRAKELFG